MIASVKVVLYKSKLLSSGDHPIMLCVSKDRNRRYVSLGVSCRPELWSTKDALPKKKHPLYTEIVAIINKAKTEASKEVLTLSAESQEYSLNQLKTVSRKPTLYNKVRVLAYFKQIEERMMASGRIGYGKTFQYTHNSLKSFRDGNDFDFIEVDTAFLIRYEEWFLSRGVKPNSVFVFMRTFKTLVNYAKKEGIVKPTYNPFAEFGFSKYRRIKTVKRAISKEQVRQIAAYRCPAEGYLLHARNYFMFSYYSRGMNFIDIAHLRWCDIKNNRLTYVRKKTKEVFTMSLLKPSLEILSFYRGTGTQQPSEESYVFPILDRDIHLTPCQIDDRIDKVLKGVNQALKRIGQDLEIKEKLTTYVARHSFATVLKRSGTSVTVISELMGHDSEQTTKVYLADFGSDVLDTAVEALL